MALPIVLILCGLLMVSGLTVWSVLGTDVRQVEVNIARVQAEFLVKGAMQLALLKTRHCSTPLYEAAFFAVGKNPAYIHSKGYAHLAATAPGTPDPLTQVIRGPAFLTGTVTLGAGGVARTLVKDIPGAPASTQNEDLNSADGLPAGQDYICDRFLNYFVLDLRDGLSPSSAMTAPPGSTVGGQATLTVSETTACPLLGSTDPYSGNFRILAMNVMGAANNRQYDREAVNVLAEATVTTRISGVTRSWTARQDALFQARRQYR